MAVTADRAWRTHAACRDMDPGIFFPTTGSDVAPAKAICAACPVAAQCGEYALGRNEDHGVWGGMSERERRRVRRQRSIARRAAVLANAV